METIQINGIDYIKKDDVEKEYKKNEDVNKPNFKEVGLHLLDNCGIMAMGNVKLDGKWSVVKVTIAYLEKSLKIMKLMETNKERDSITIAVGTDYPLCIGEINDNNMFSGVVIAPRVSK